MSTFFDENKVTLWELEEIVSNIRAEWAIETPDYVTDNEIEYQLSEIRTNK